MHIYSLSPYTDKKKSYAEIILTNEIPPWCDIPSRRVTIMSSRRVITSWRHTFLDAISHCNFDFVGSDMMTGWHIITRWDGILHRGGISLVSNISRKRFYYFYRRGPDCLVVNLKVFASSLRLPQFFTFLRKASRALFNYHYFISGSIYQFVKFLTRKWGTALLLLLARS